MTNIKLSDQAKTKIRNLLKDKDPRTWGVMIPDQAGTYIHLPLIDLSTLPSIDEVQFIEDLKVVLDRSGEEVEEVSVDFVDGGVLSSVFEVKAIKPQGPAAGKLDSADPAVAKILEVLEKEINPAIASHGGYAKLLDYKDGKVYLFMGGGCQGCHGVDATLKMGIETRLREVVPEISGIIDQTDHAAGTNPYFTAAGHGH
ncbi:MAG TPA: NifU family protein [bacterium]|nr:NifU family protein [bacterium]